MLLFLAGAAAARLPAREALGQFGRWGAFREGRRCAALAEPELRRDDAARPFVGILFDPAAGARGQVTVRLSRPADPLRPAVLAIRDVGVPLRVSGRLAAPAEAGGDRRVIAAIRRGALLRVTAMGPGGAAFTDAYPLRGAASAIDAAAVGCLR